MTVYIHAGLPKTGTTAIQLACHRSRAVLAAAGLNYWAISSRHNWPLSVLVRGVQGRRAGFGEVEASLSDAIREEGDLLISAEGVCQMDEATLARLKGFTGEAVIVLFVREPRAWFTSLAQQRIKTGDTYAQAVAALLNQGSPRPRVERLMTTYAEVRLRLYRSGELFADFMSAVDRPSALAGELEAGAENTGLSGPATTALSERNAEAEQPPSTRLLRRLGPFGGPRFALDGEDMRALLGEHGEDIAWTSQQLGVDLLGLPGPTPSDASPLGGREVRRMRKLIVEEDERGLGAAQSFRLKAYAEAARR